MALTIAPGLVAGYAVDRLSDDVGVTVVSRGLLDHVDQDRPQVDLRAPWGGDHVVEPASGYHGPGPLTGPQVLADEGVGRLVGTDAELGIWVVVGRIRSASGELA